MKWLDLDEGDLKTTGFRKCRWKSQNLVQWREILKEVKVYYGL
jgi:hypothetical protein